MLLYWVNAFASLKPQLVTWSHQDFIGSGEKICIILKNRHEYVKGFCHSFSTVWKNKTSWFGLSCVTTRPQDGGRKDDKKSTVKKSVYFYVWFTNRTTDSDLGLNPVRNSGAQQLFFTWYLFNAKYVWFTSLKLTL